MIIIGIFRLQTCFETFKILSLDFVEQAFKENVAEIFGKPRISLSLIAVFYENKPPRDGTLEIRLPIEKLRR